MLVVSRYFQLCVNQRFSLVFRFQTRDACQMHNQYKTGADRGNILGQPKLFECMSICVLSPVHKSEMRGYLVDVLIVKYLSHRFCLNSATVYQIGRLTVDIFWGFFETFLEGSVDHVIYRNYTVNRRFFVYCSLACSVTALLRKGGVDRKSR